MPADQGFENSGQLFPAEGILKADGLGHVVDNIAAVQFMKDVESLLGRRQVVIVHLFRGLDIQRFVCPGLADVGGETFYSGGFEHDG